jgi:hypothetical protein
LVLNKKRFNLAELNEDMNIEKKLLSLSKAENKEKDVIGIRFVNKIEENKWKFRFTYRDGDFLSMSDEFEAEFNGLKLELVKKPIFVSPGVFTSETDNSSEKEKVNNLNNK